MMKSHYPPQLCRSRTPGRFKLPVHQYVGFGRYSSCLKRPNLRQGYRNHVIFPVTNSMEMGPYVLLSRVWSAGPSPSTQMWPCGTLTTGWGCGALVFTYSPSIAMILLTAMVSGLKGLLRNGAVMSAAENKQEQGVSTSEGRT